MNTAFAGFEAQVGTEHNECDGESMHGSWKCQDSERSDASLLADLRWVDQRSEIAAGLLFDRHHRGLTRYFRRRGALPEDAEELLQETFLKLVRSVREGAEPDSIGYLWRCAETVLLDRVKHDSAQRRDAAMVSMDSDQFGEIQGHHDVEDDSLVRCIEQTLRVFASRWPDRGELIYLIVREQWTPREIASFLGNTMQAARQRVYECRKQLRAMVERRCLGMGVRAVVEQDDTGRWLRLMRDEDVPEADRIDRLMAKAARRMLLSGESEQDLDTFSRARIRRNIVSVVEEENRIARLARKRHSLSRYLPIAASVMLAAVLGGIFSFSWQQPAILPENGGGVSKQPLGTSMEVEPVRFGKDEWPAIRVTLLDALRHLSIPYQASADGTRIEFRASVELIQALEQTLHHDRIQLTPNVNYLWSVEEKQLESGEQP